MNAELLRKVMRDKGFTVKKMCSELGISRKAFWAKCNGRSEFKQSEIAKTIDILGTEYGTAIFFPSKVS